MKIDSRNDVPIVFMAHLIFKFFDQRLLGGKILLNKLFSKHCNTYEVEHAKNYFVVKAGERLNHQPLDMHDIKGTFYI